MMTTDKVTKFVENLRARETVTAECAGAVPARHAEPPYSDAPPTDAESTLLGLLELLLKDQRRLDFLARSASLQRELIPRLLAVGLAGYTIFGVALGFVYSAARRWPELAPLAQWLEGSHTALVQFVPEPAFWLPWTDGSVLRLIASFALGMIGAIGVCLPSFYFYGLLAGVQTTMLQVTVSALKGMASSAVALVGVLPIYFAAVLGLLVFPAPDPLVILCCSCGLVLPFLAGLYGTRSLYIGFIGLAETMEADRRCQRECFLRRLILAWSACFTAVTPVMIFTLWHLMNRS